MMNTETAKRIAENRQVIMENYLDEFIEECEGELLYVRSKILLYSI